MTIKPARMLNIILKVIYQTVESSQLLRSYRSQSHMTKASDIIRCQLTISKTRPPYEVAIQRNEEIICLGLLVYSLNTLEEENFSDRNFHGSVKP